MYSSSDEEEALLFLVLEDEENSRFVFVAAAWLSSTLPLLMGATALSQGLLSL